MLATPDGQFLSQRTHPRLCLVRATPVEGIRFTLEAPGMDPFDLIPAPSDVWTEVQVHKDRFSALAGYDEANRWFSDFLRAPCQLVFIPDEVRRPVDPEWAPGHRVSLADGYPLHLTTEESLREVNRQLSRKTTMLSYRPNLVLAGGKPWEEDEWRVLEIGGVRVLLVKPCARCTVITVDPGTGIRGREPLRGPRWNASSPLSWSMANTEIVFESAPRSQQPPAARVEVDIAWPRAPDRLDLEHLELPAGRLRTVDGHAVVAAVCRIDKSPTRVDEDLGGRVEGLLGLRLLTQRFHRAALLELARVRIVGEGRDRQREAR